MALQPMNSSMDDFVQAMTQSVLANMAAQQKAAGSTPTTIYAHGPGGLFSQPGLRPDLTSALILPGMKLMEALPPPEMNRYTSEVLGILTGQTDATGTDPTAACADCAQPGNLKLCNTVLPFGRYCLDSQVLQVDRIGQRVNRSDNIDLRLLGDTLTRIPNYFTVSGQDILISEPAKKLAEMQIAWYRRWARKPYTANPSNTAGSTGVIDYNGLDILVNTGYRDAYTGIACPAADSLVRSFGGLQVGTNAAAAIGLVVATMRFLEDLADRTGNLPVQWIMSMRRGLFLALTDVWPCVYNTYRCSSFVSSPVTVNIEGREARMMIDEMRMGSYLLVDGKRYPVVVDDSVVEAQPSPSVFESDIYILPTYFAGGVKGTYFEYFPLDNSDIQAALRDFAPGDSYRVIGDGKFMLHKKPPTNWCIQTAMVGWMRLVLRVPFLAARLTDFRYTFEADIHEREWDSSSPYSSFFADGGQTNWTGIQQSYYTPTA